MNIRRGIRKCKREREKKWRSEDEVRQRRQKREERKEGKVEDVIRNWRKRVIKEILEGRRRNYI